MHMKIKMQSKVSEHKRFFLLKYHFFPLKTVGQCCPFIKINGMKLSIRKRNICNIKLILCS